MRLDDGVSTSVTAHNALFGVARYFPSGNTVMLIAGVGEIGPVQVYSLDALHEATHVAVSITRESVPIRCNAS